MHGLLQEQLNECFGRTQGFAAEMERLVTLVDQAYARRDAEREMIQLAMVRNSHELMERNRALAEAETKYRTIFENVNEGIFQSTVDGRILSANPAMAKLAGYDTPEDLIAGVTDISRQLWVEPSERQRLLEDILEQGHVTNWEAKFQRHDGSSAWVAINSRPVRDAEGKLLYFQGTMRDITARKTAEAERHALQKRLVDASRQAGRAEVATGVLHNVGNVLNSVNVSVTMASERLKASQVAGVARLAELIRGQGEQLPTFFVEDERGRRVPEYLSALAERLTQDQAEMLKELESLARNVDHIKQIVATQQGYAKGAGISERVEVGELIADALRLKKESLERHGVKVTPEIEPIGTVTLDKHTALQIVVNLIANARQAMVGNAAEKLLLIRAEMLAGNTSRFVIRVRDNGMGIEKDNLTRIFSHGFTTKPDGHGFGLHTSALEAQGMGGSLTAQSDGPGKGATFTLELPMGPGAANTELERQEAVEVRRNS